MKIDLKLDMSKAKRLLAQLHGAEMRQAAANALNDAAFEARRVVQRNMDTSFDKVTPYIKRSVQVDKATAGQLMSVVSAKYMGGKGIDPQNVLRHEIAGGGRKDKASERALSRVGILPRGYSLVPGEAAPLDRYGNIRGSFMVQLLSYLNAMGEQGYRANMTDKRRSKLRDQRKTDRGYMRTFGVRYFVSSGRLRSGKTEHLPAGIWSAEGTHDVVIKPVVMFVRKPSYRTRLDFYDRPVRAAVQKFNPRLRYHVRLILEGRAR